MPELPEVETMRRGIAPVIGCCVAAVSRPRSRYKPILIQPAPTQLARRLTGRHITATDRIGKRVVLQLEGDLRLVFEPRMTGLVLLADPPNLEHLRLRIDLCQGPAEQLLYWDRRGLGSVRLFSAAQLAERYLSGHLGPDALTLSAAELRQRLAASRRPIKVALLDQQRLAGIGNLYASEILHQAGIHPTYPCHRLSQDQWHAIHAATRAILEAAIRYEGSTLGDGTYRNALNQTGNYQNHHRVYDRAGQPCRTCGREAIVRLVQAQRSTFFCPACQPMPRRSPTRRPPTTSARNGS